MGAKFLCCLPLRLGVLVIAFIQFIITGGAAGLVWWLFAASSESELTEKLKASIIVIGAVYTASALICLVGFIGALAKKLGAIRTYLFVLYITLVIQIAVTVYCLITYYHLRNESQSDADCTVTDQGTTVNLCETYSKIPQAVVLVTTIVPILIQMYACYIVSAYKNRLLNQKYKHTDTGVAMNSSINPIYTSVPATEHGFPVTQTNAPYVYGSGPHAFGNMGGAHHA